MNTMSREAEIALVREMIEATEEKIKEENSDKLYLEAELKLLQEEYMELLYPESVMRRIICITPKR